MYRGFFETRCADHFLYDRPPLKKQQIFADIPTMITERKDKGLVKDDLFIAGTVERLIWLCIKFILMFGVNSDPKGQSSASLPSIPVHKSHSAVNLVCNAYSTMTKKLKIYSYYTYCRSIFTKSHCRPSLC
jgi:hypothetical protein